MPESALWNGETSYWLLTHGFPVKQANVIVKWKLVYVFVETPVGMMCSIERARKSWMPGRGLRNWGFQGSEILQMKTKRGPEYPSKVRTFSGMRLTDGEMEAKSKGLEREEVLSAI